MRGRRYVNRSRSALGNANLHSLKAAVGTLFDRVQQSNLSPSITPLQVLALTAPSEHRATLANIHEITKVGEYWRDNEVEINLNDDWRVEFDSRHCSPQETLPLWPKNPELQPDHDPAIVEEIVAWAGRRLEIGWEFGRLERALEALDACCSSLSQVRYYWPSITALARVAGLNDLVEKLDIAAGRVPNHLPSLPMGLRDALRAGAGTVAIGSLMENQDRVERKEWAKHYVEITPQERRSKSYRDEGFGSYGPK